MLEVRIPAIFEGEEGSSDWQMALGEYFWGALNSLILAYMVVTHVL